MFHIISKLLRKWANLHDTIYFAGYLNNGNLFKYHNEIQGLHNNNEVLKLITSCRSGRPASDV